MPSNKEKQRVLSGTLNLLPPSDKIPDGDSTLLDNWRVDQQGQLLSRQGSRLLLGPMGSGSFHTLTKIKALRFMGIGSDLYIGGNAAVLLDTNFDGSPLGIAHHLDTTWVMNPGRRVRIDYDTGAPVVHQWGIPPPASAPTAIPGNQSPIVKLFTEYETPGSGYAPTLVQTTVDGINFEIDMDAAGNPIAGTTLAAASYDSQILVNGATSLKVQVNQAATVFMDTICDASPIDTTINGIAQDQDVFSVWIWCSDPSKIKQFNVAITSGDPDDELTNAHLAVFFDDPTTVLNQGSKTWTRIQIRRTLNVDDLQAKIAEATSQAAQGLLDYQVVTDLTAQLTQQLQTPHFLELTGSTPQVLGPNQTPPQGPPRFDWTNVTRLRLTFQVTDSVTINLDRSEFFGFVGASLSGSIAYFVSFANNIDQDSNPSPISNTIICNNEGAKIDSIPISADPQVTQRWLYRIGGGLNQPLLVKRFLDNTFTGPYFDQTDNATAQADGIVMPINRTTPPFVSGLIGPFLGKLIAYGSSQTPARYFWTPSAQPWFFPGNDEALGNWEDAGGDDDGIVVITDHKLQLLIYKSRSIWRLAGDPVNTDPVKTNSNIGAVGPLAVANGGSIDYVVGAEGVYIFNGDFETKISPRLDPLFKGDPVQLTNGEYIPGVNRARLQFSVLTLLNDRLRFSYVDSSSGGNTPTKVLIYNVVTGAWASEKYNTVTAAAGVPSAPSVMNYEGQGNPIVGGFTGSNGGYLYELESLVSPTKDDGAAIHVAWQSRFSDQGLPDNLKHYSDVEIDFQTAVQAQIPSTLSVYLVYSNGTKLLLGTISSSSRTTAILPVTSVQEPSGSQVGIVGKNAAIRIEGDVTSTCIVFGTYLHWYPEERRALSFDSGFTDLGGTMAERAKQVDHVEVYATGGGQTPNLILSSDLPGSQLAQRYIGPMLQPLQIGRGTSRFRLPAIVEGRNLRLTVSSTVPFQAHSVQIRMRPVGEYIDGTTGEYYESPEFSAAPGRVGELKDLLLDYDSTGVGSFVLYADLGANGLQVVRTIPIPSGGRRTFAFALEAGDPLNDLPYGTLFKIRLYPAAGGILRLHGRATIRARVIGVFFDGSANEIWETQALDLLGGIGLFREVSIIAQTAGPMVFETQIEEPTQNLLTHASFQFDSTLTTTGRASIFSRLPGNTKGTIQRFRLTGPYVTRIYEVKVLARKLQVNASSWEWIPVPMEPTPNEWTQIQMPVRQTPESFDWVSIPVDPIM